MLVCECLSVDPLHSRQGEASMQEAGDRRSALTLAQAEHCVGALRDSACAACRQGAKEVAAAGLSAAVMARLSGLDDAARSGAWNSPGTRHAAAAIDTRIEVRPIVRALDVSWLLNAAAQLT